MEKNKTDIYRGQDVDLQNKDIADEPSYAIIMEPRSADVEQLLPRILSAFQDGTSALRTAGGIARDTGLPIDRIVEALESHPELFAQSDVRPAGIPVYRLLLKQKAVAA